MTRDQPDDLPTKPSKEAADTVLSTADIAAYIADMVSGMRELTKGPGTRELGLLDYLLAVAEDEASKLAVNVYH